LWLYIIVFEYSLSDMSNLNILEQPALDRAVDVSRMSSESTDSNTITLKIKVNPELNGFEYKSISVGPDDLENELKASPFNEKSLTQPASELAMNKLQSKTPPTIVSPSNSPAVVSPDPAMSAPAPTAPAPPAPVPAPPAPPSGPRPTNIDSKGEPIINDQTNPETNNKPNVAPPPPPPRQQKTDAEQVINDQTEPVAKNVLTGMANSTSSTEMLNQAIKQELENRNKNKNKQVEVEEADVAEEEWDGTGGNHKNTRKRRPFTTSRHGKLIRLSPTEFNDFLRLSSPEISKPLHRRSLRESRRSRKVLHIANRKHTRNLKPKRNRKNTHKRI
jgi:hypothetical protein